MCVDYPPGSFADVTHNNLGDKGPGTGDALIEYSNFMEHEGTTVKMVVEALTEYTPHGVHMNGIGQGGEFGEIGISTGSNVTLKFTLKDQSNDAEVTLPGFYFTIYDIGTFFCFLFGGAYQGFIFGNNSLTSFPFKVVNCHLYTQNITTHKLLSMNLLPVAMCRKHFSRLLCLKKSLVRLERKCSKNNNVYKWACIG